jgi:hypothetical protein
MSDFIDHLLAQVRPGTAAVLEPRAPSRFELARPAGDDGSESVAVPEPAVAPAVAAPVTALSPPRRAKRAPVAPPAVREPEVSARPAPVEARPPPLWTEGPEPPRRPLTAGPAADAPVPHRADAPRSADQPAAELRPHEVRVEVPGEPAAVEPREIVHELVIRETPREIAPPEPAAEASRPEVAEPLIPRADPPPLAALAPVQPQLPAAIAEPAPREPPLPIVEVRIGRIEIHAPPSPAPAAEAAPPPAAASASRLDRYLSRG